jgi:hypothetical protein
MTPAQRSGWEGRRLAPLAPAEAQRIARHAAELALLVAAAGAAEDPLPRGVVVAWAVELLLMLEAPESDGAR